MVAALSAMSTDDCDAIVAAAEEPLFVARHTPRFDAVRMMDTAPHHVAVVASLGPTVVIDKVSSRLYGSTSGRRIVAQSSAIVISCQQMVHVATAQPPE